MLRRTVRRASRYLQTTIVVLSGAEQRHRLSKSRSRAQRGSTRRAEVAVTRLLTTTVRGLTQRQQLFTQQQYNLKARSARLLEAKSRFLRSAYRAKSSRTPVQVQRDILRLQRKLSTRRSATKTTVSPAYRSLALLQGQFATRAARLLEIKAARVQNRGVFDKKYLVSPFPAVKQFEVNRRIRHIARQRQKPFTQSSTVALQLHPADTSIRYSELRRRLQFKTRIADEQAYLFPTAGSITVSRLPEVSAFTRGTKTTL